MTGGLDPCARATRANPYATFSRLFSTYFREVWSWLAVLGVRPADLREATHDTFCAAWEVLDDLAGAPSCAAWVFHRTAEVSRSRRTRAFAVATGGDAHGPRPALDRLLAPLTEVERVTFLLFELGGVPIPRIAEFLGASGPQVAEHLRTARLRGADFDGSCDEGVEPRRLLSPTTHTPRPLRIALQSALPLPPSARDEDEVESALVDFLASRKDGARPSGVARRLKEF